MRKHNKKIIFILLILLIIWKLIIAIKQGGDLESYLRASTRIIEDKPIYIEEVVAYIYPPLLAFLLIPLSILNITAAKIFWFAGNIIFIYISLKLLLKTINNEDINTFNIGFLSILFTLQFFMNNSNLGQVNVVILLLCTLTLYFFINEKDLHAGLFLSMAIVIKITPVFLLFYFIIKREFRLSVYTITGVLFFLFIPSLMPGFSGNIEALVQYKDMVQGITDLSHLNQSLYNTIFHLLSPVPLWNNMTINFAVLSESQIKVIIYALFGIILLIFGLLFRKRITNRRNINISIEFSMIIILMLLFSVVTRKAHFVILFIPHFFYIYSLIKFKSIPDRKIVIILLIVSFVLNTLIAQGFVGRELSDIADSFSCKTLGAISLLLGLVIIKRNLENYT